jgi:uncharacterized protein YggE
VNISKRTGIVAALGGVILLSMTAAVCGDTNTRVENTGERETGITVAGEGKTTAAPDVAILTLGVSTIADTVASARESAAGSLQAMIDTMKRNGVAEKDIQTTQFSIYPEYDYDGNRQVLRGFRVSNVVTAKVRDIDTTSTVVDDAVVAGGDNATIQNLAFTIDDPEELRREARELAVEDARKRAQTLADAGGVSLGRPVTISESSGFQPPVYYADGAIAEDSARAALPPTPIEPGELDVVITVSVTFAIE